MSSWKHTLNWLPPSAKKKIEQALVDRKQGCSRVGNFGFNNEFQKYLHWDIRFVFLLHSSFKFWFECLHNLLLHARAKWQWWKEKPSATCMKVMTHSDWTKHKKITFWNSAENFLKLDYTNNYYWDTKAKFTRYRRNFPLMENSCVWAFVHMEQRQTWTSKRSKFGRISVGAVNNLTATMWTPLTSKFLYGEGVAV